MPEVKRYGFLDDCTPGQIKNALKVTLGWTDMLERQAGIMTSLGEVEAANRAESICKYLRLMIDGALTEEHPEDDEPTAPVTSLAVIRGDRR